MQKFCQLFVFVCIQTGRSSLQKQTISNPPSISKPYPTLQKTCHPTISNPPNKLEVSSLECTFRTPLPEASSKALGFKVACQPFRNLKRVETQALRTGRSQGDFTKALPGKPRFLKLTFSQKMGGALPPIFRGFC